MKKLICLGIALAALFAAVLSLTVSAENGLPFSDVPEGSWFYGPVRAVWDSGIMKGTASDRFGPDERMTRGQIVTILARLSGDDCSGAGAKTGFSDVPAGEYYADPVGWAVRTGITKGRSASRFEPDAPVLRQEFAAFFIRYMRYKGISVPEEDAEPFPDEFPDWAREDFEALHRTGLVKGDARGRFNPGDEMTRAEIATVTSRFQGEIRRQNGYERVVIIGVDGAGAYFREADTPNLDRIFADGAVTYDMLTSLPTISAQCWGSLLHGVTPEYHRLTNSVVANREFRSDSPFPSVFRVIRDKYPDAELASFCNWTPINNGIVENGIGVYKDGGGDRAITDKICEYLKDHDPKILFVQFDEVDGSGHNNGFGSEKQLAQIGVEDGYIDRIYKAYEERGFLDGTLFIVTADHGGSGESHGGTSDTEKYVMFAAAGHSVEKGSPRDMGIRDIAAVVLYALGADRPEGWTARVPAGVFRNVPEERRPEYEIRYVAEHRTHESVPTPPLSELKKALGDRALRFYMPMDGDLSEAVGGYEPKKIGKLYFVDGFFGSGATFDDGIAYVRNMTFGSAPFSVCFWMKAPSIPDADEFMLIGNRGTQFGETDGFVLIKRIDDLRLVIYGGEDSPLLDFQLPADSDDGWVHVALSIDTVGGKAKISYDFGDFITFDTPYIVGRTLDGNERFGIGTDGELTTDIRFPGTLDELMVLDGVLTDDDLYSLAKYYGIEKQG